MGDSLTTLIEEFSKLPGIGPKTAQRLSFHIIKKKPEEVKKLIKALIDAKEKLNFCKECGSFTEGDTCNICKNPNRDRSIVTVVQESSDVITIERTKEYSGLYHVLHGVISPMDGIGPEDIRITELIQRLQAGEIEEIIVATNPNIEGEATALFISNLVKPSGIKVTRLAYGLPVGGNLDYADDMTLSRAFQGRHSL